MSGMSNEQFIVVLQENDDYYVRAYAAMRLGQIGDPRAVEPLIAALQEDDSESVRQYAAEALGEIRDPRAVEPLISALQEDGELDVREEAAEALKLITREDFGLDHGKWRKWWQHSKGEFPGQ